MRATSIRNRTKIYKHFSAAVGSHSSRNTIVQCTILFCRRVRYASRSLMCILALDVPLDTAHERPYGWMVTLEQWLQPMVLPLNAAVAAVSYVVGACSVLIPGFHREYDWTVSCCTSSSCATTDISMFEKWRQFVHVIDSCCLRLTQKFERLLHVFRRNADDGEISPGQVAPGYLSLRLNVARWTVSV